MAGKRRVLVLGTADWQQPIATNQHYVVRELARSFEVCFVESLGLRRPRANFQDASRIMRRILNNWRRDRPDSPSYSDRHVPNNVTVISPLLLPWHNRATYRLNRYLLQRALRAWSMSDSVLFTFSPATYGLHDDAADTVYYCVDLLDKVVGISPEVVRQGEDVLARLGCRAVATSEVVASHLDSRGFRDVMYWPNVADTEVIENRAITSGGRVPGRVVFAGNLKLGKVDFEILQAIASHKDVELHLAGPTDDAGQAGRQALQGLIDAGAKYHGCLSLEQLADLYLTCEVGVIPYLVNDYTLGVYPLKVWEYFSAGLSVIATPLPALEGIAGDDLVLARDAAAFVGALDGRHVWSPARRSVRVLLARDHSWTGRGDQVRDLARDMHNGSFGQ